MNAREKIRLGRRYRIIPKTDEAQALLTEIKGELQIPYGPLDDGVLRGLAHRLGGQLVAEVVLLTASIERARGNYERSLDLIEQAAGLLSATPSAVTFALLFERGLSAYLIGDFSVALDHFLGASTASEHPSERVNSLMNALFCMENLALPYEGMLARASQALDEFPTTDPLDVEEKTFHERRLTALSDRMLFRSGSVEHVCRAREAVDRLDYFEYARMFRRLLPFHRFATSVDASFLERLASHAGHFHLKLYRLRTLQGFLHPDDVKNVVPSEFVDRLYLWVWRWLVRPDLFPVERVMALLSGSPPILDLHRFTVEDGWMLKNAFLWLSLFDPASQDVIGRWVRRVRIPESPGYELFDFENSVIHFLLAATGENKGLADGYRESLERHPLWNSKDLFFSELVRLIVDEQRPIEAGFPFAKLAENLRKLLHERRVRPGVRILADVARLQITDLFTDQRVISEAMVRALDLLEKRSVVPADEFCSVCFGITRFDPLIHNSKIFNLLSRLKTVTGGILEWRSRQGRVLADGNWSQVQVIRTPGLVAELGQQPEWRRLVFEREERTERLANAARAVRRDRPGLPLGSSGGPLSRQEIERILGKSRSSVNRLLLEWEKQGLASKVGSARSTRYVIEDTAWQEGLRDTVVDEEN